LAECVTIVEGYINGGGSIPGLVVVVQEVLTDAANADGALKTHVDNFSNKVTVATYHTITKEAAAEWEIPSTVTSDATTITAANAAVDTATAPAAAAAQVKSLTVGVDNVIGGSGDDLILGTIDTTTAANNVWSTADVLNGGEGSDTVQIAVANSGAVTYTPALITNVESIRIVSTAGAAPTFDLTAVEGLTSVELSSSTNGSDIDNLTTTATKLNATANTGASDFAFKAAALVGTDTAIDLTLTSNSGDVTVGGTGAGIESVKITSIGVNTGGRYVGTGTDVTSLTVEGSGSLAVNALDMPGVTTLDATGNSGGVTFNATASNTTLKGGTGNDVLSDGAGNDVITGGAGNDTLTGGAGNDNIDGGAGDDVAVVTGIDKDDTVTGGEGTDTLSMASGTAYSATVSDGSGISGFEVISNTGAAAMTQNISGLGTNAFTTLAIAGSGAATIQEGAITTIATTLASGTAVLGLKTDSAADVLTVALGAAGGARSLGLSALDYETININSTGTATNSVALADTEASYLATTAAEITARTAAFAARKATDLTTVNITGNKAMTFASSAKSTAVATLNAAEFSGATINMNASSSDAAVTATANTATSATITTGDGADTVTVGNGGTALANNIITGKGGDTVTSGAGADTINVGTGSTAGANKVTSGAGNDTITAGDGADTIDAGAGDDQITGAKGADTITAGDGNDTVTTTDGNDTVDGGTGNDNITTGKGNDSITAGDGNDTIDSGTGSDYVSGGTGNDTITVGTGDDTVDGGTGNDTITVQTLSNGDSLVGGDGTDTLTIAAISSTSTPKNISGMEKITVTSLGGGAAGIDLDLTNVSGLTSLTSVNTTTGGVTMNIKSAPSTLTALSLDDSGVGALDTLALTYASGPTSLTFNAFDVTNAATNITSLNAPLTINAVVGTSQAGLGQPYAAGNISALGTMTTDASAMTLTTDALGVGQAGSTDSLTIGAITNSVLETMTISTGANSNATISSGNLTTTNTEFTSYKLTAGAASIVTLGEVVADSASGSVLVDIDAGASSAITLGNADSTFDAAAVTIDINLGDQSSITTGGATNNIVGNTVVSTNIVAGAGVGVTGTHVVVPGPEVDAVTGTIGATTINAGILSYIDVGVGLSTNAADTGAVTLSGGGHIKLTLGAGNAATYTPAGAAVARSSQGDVSAAAMTSPLSSLTVVGTNAKGAFALTGGAGNDTLAGGKGKDTITAGKGVDSITTGADADIVIFNEGDSNPVYSNVKTNSTGQDSVADNGTAATAAILQFNITSTDTAWSDLTHIQIGTANGNIIASATEGNTAGFKAKTVLVQTGGHVGINTTNSDPQDIVVNVNTLLNAGQARAISQVNLTGTAGADTLTTGALQDTVDGGAGNDTVDAGDGADRVIVSSGDDTVIVADGDGIANTASTLATGGIAVSNTITFANGVDTVVGFEAGTGGDVMNMAVAGLPTTAIGVASNSLTATKTLFLSGAYVSSTGVFTVAADGAGADTLLMDTTTDQNVSATAGDSFVLLLGVDSDNLVAANVI
jgi:Ca2+-binding RTX toxin-like protein